MNDGNKSRLVSGASNVLCIIPCNDILLPGLSGRRKRCVDDAEQGEARECQGCVGIP